MCHSTPLHLTPVCKVKLDECLGTQGQKGVPAGPGSTPVPRPLLFCKTKQVMFPGLKGTDEEVVPDFFLRLVAAFPKASLDRAQATGHSVYPALCTPHTSNMTKQACGQSVGSCVAIIIRL